jgi:hypothetical protein
LTSRPTIPSTKVARSGATKCREATSRPEAQGVMELRSKKRHCQVKRGRDSTKVAGSHQPRDQEAAYLEGGRPELPSNKGGRNVATK